MAIVGFFQEKRRLKTDKHEGNFFQNSCHITEKLNFRVFCIWYGFID